MSACVYEAYTEFSVEIKQQSFLLFSWQFAYIFWYFNTTDIKMNRRRAHGDDDPYGKQIAQFILLFILRKKKIPNLKKFQC